MIGGARYRVSQSGDMSLIGSHHAADFGVAARHPDGAFGEIRLNLNGGWRRGDWEGVFARMACELRRKIGAAAPLEVEISVAPGELIDKITILEIKMERIRDTVKLANVRAELAELTAARERCLPNSAELARLTGALKTVNEALWQVEDDLRDCERARDFGPRFVQLARSVYQHNDRRAALKRQINEQLGSRLIEEKSYAAY